MGLNDIPSFAKFTWIGVIALITFITMLHIVYSKFGRRDDKL